jgi:hypothetical protein
VGGHGLIRHGSFDRISLTAGPPNAAVAGANTKTPTKSNFGLIVRRNDCILAGTWNAIKVFRRGDADPGLMKDYLAVHSGHVGRSALVRRAYQADRAFPG